MWGPCGLLWKQTCAGYISDRWINHSWHLILTHQFQPVKSHSATGRHRDDTPALCVACALLAARPRLPFHLAYVSHSNGVLDSWEWVRRSTDVSGGYGAHSHLTIKSVFSQKQGRLDLCDWQEKPFIDNPLWHAVGFNPNCLGRFPGLILIIGIIKHIRCLSP